MKLTLKNLIKEAEIFCKKESKLTHPELLGISDGKAVGTYIEQRFKNHLKRKYRFDSGSCAKGIDFPDSHINTDIKVTSTKRPPSSTPFKNIEQKIYGLCHNLLVLVYKKREQDNKCYLEFKHCIFIPSEQTGDYNLTKKLRKMINRGTTEHEITDLLNEKNIPGSRKHLMNLAKRILSNPPQQGYLTISNALQWRLKYQNAINLKDQIMGNYKHDKIQ